jgi:hypothetical protein
MIGYVSRNYNPSATNQLEMYPWEFTGQESGWSGTQTVAVPSSPTSGSASPTQAIPTINTGPIINTYWGLNYGEVIIIVILAVIALLLAVLIPVIRGRKK